MRQKHPEYILVHVHVGENCGVMLSPLFSTIIMTLTALIKNVWMSRKHILVFGNRWIHSVSEAYAFSYFTATEG